MLAQHVQCVVFPDPALLGKLMGFANAFKEGDQLAGLAATSEAQRESARTQLSAVTLATINQFPVFKDTIYTAIMASLDSESRQRTEHWTLGQLKTFLVEASAEDIRQIMPGLSSDIIGAVVRLLTNAQLIEVSGKIFNPLPGSNLGNKGYLGARLQPNSPTDDPEDIRWQVFNGWAFAIGDLVLGTNPVSSEVESVHRIELVLKDLIDTFGLSEVLPHTVLAHIDVQAEVERRWPQSTALWFQSLAGSDAANRTFGVSLDGLYEHADNKTGKFALYFETGQGADFTNGHAQGMDMVMHESRKYGLARLLGQKMTRNGRAPWLHVNDVAGFIGPEVFRTREQLVRCCLEDLVMGKLHGLCIGLDVCSTLHMDVSLDDLDYCLESIAPANPAYLMALPTKIDPMLGYLTTGYHDHLRLRRRFDFQISAEMAKFFRELGVLSADNERGPVFGKTELVYLAYCRRKGDARPDADILAEARRQMDAVEGRGVFLANGSHRDPGLPAPQLQARTRQIYEEGKRAIWAGLPADFGTDSQALRLETTARNREEYLLKPKTGEHLSTASTAVLEELKERWPLTNRVQIVVSDGLNALAIANRRQFDPFIATLKKGLSNRSTATSAQDIMLHFGRVRAGYRIGEQLFGGRAGAYAMLHIIGERPGTGHDCFSIYMTVADGADWGRAGKIDHDITRVVAGISNSTTQPEAAAETALRIFDKLWAPA